MKFVADRLEICQSCPERKPMLGQYLNQCSACSCVIEFKVSVPWVRCPQGRWLEYDQIDPDVRDILINDAYHSLSVSPNAYTQAIRAKFAEVFGPEADIQVLYADLVERRNQHG